MVRPIYNKIALMVLCLVAVFFSLYKLTESPPFWYDEGWYVQVSANLAATGIDGVQLAPGYVYHVPSLTVGYPLLYVMGAWIRLFGSGMFTIRLLMVAFILLFLVAAYWAVRRAWGPWYALGTLSLLATFAPLYGNGKSVLGEIPGMAYLVFFILCYGIAKSDGIRRLFWYILAGVSAGLCIATKPLFILLVPALVVVAFIDWRRRLLSAKEIGITILAVIVPIIVWLVVQFYGTNVASILSFYANPYGSASLMQVVVSNIGRILTDTSTLYTGAILLAWLVGIVIRTRRRERIAAEEWGAFVFSILVALAFLRIGSVYRYLLPAQLLALMFLPISLGAICPRRKKCVMTCVVLLSFLGLYQLSFSSWVADAYHNDKTAFWASYMRALPTQTSVFFYDTPEVVLFMLSRNYYQYLLTPALHPTGTEQLSILRNGAADLVIVVTDKYEPLKNTLFRHYTVQQTAYKYSILKLSR